MDGSVNALASFLSSPTTVYSGDPGAGASDVNLKIIYNNTNPNAILAQFLVNGIQVGSYDYGASGAAFDHLFLRSYLLGGGTVSNLDVTVTQIPEPPLYAAAVGIGVFVLALAYKWS